MTEAAEPENPEASEAFHDAREYTKLLRARVERRFFECHAESLLNLIAELDFWLKGTEPN